MNNPSHRKIFFTVIFDTLHMVLLGKKQSVQELSERVVLCFKMH